MGVQYILKKICLYYHYKKSFKSVLKCKKKDKQYNFLVWKSTAAIRNEFRSYKCVFFYWNRQACCNYSPIMIMFLFYFSVTSVGFGQPKTENM